MHNAFKRFLHRIRPSLCADCRMKLDKKYGLRHKVKHAARHSGRKLRAGIHYVKIKGKTRKVKVLANGRWRFMKNRR